MIVTTLSELWRYQGLNARLDQAFDWLKNAPWNDLPIGKHEIQGDEIYALVQEYETKEPDQCKFESHRLYIDIQVILEGKEIIEALPVQLLEISEPYTPDIAFYKLPTQVKVKAHSLAMGAHDIAIFFPEDAHRPCMRIGGRAESVRKVVVKVAL